MEEINSKAFSDELNKSEEGIEDNQCRVERVKKNLFSYKCDKCGKNFDIRRGGKLYNNETLCNECVK